MNLLTPFRRRAGLPAGLNLFDQWMRDFFEENGRSANIDAPMLPKANVAETDKDYAITLELPGLDESEVDVRLSGDQLIIAGERKQKKEEKDKHYYLKETSYGAFERRFDLPSDARKEADSIKATFNKGMLEVRIAKVETRQPTKIAVKTV